MVSLGDLQSEEERDIVIPINLEAVVAECIAQPLIKVTLSYFNVITTLMQTSVVDLTVDRKPAGTLTNACLISVHNKQTNGIARAIEVSIEGTVHFVFVELHCYVIMLLLMSY